MDEIKRDFQQKFRRHMSWEMFWVMLRGSIVGIALVIFGIILFNRWGAMVSTAAIIGGLLWATFGFWRAKHYWDKS